MKKINENLVIEKLIKQAVRQRVSSEQDLRKLKAEIAAEFGVPMFANSRILAIYEQMINRGKVRGEVGNAVCHGGRCGAHDRVCNGVRNETLWRLLTKRKIRNLSGVAVITVLTKPYPCPGRCVYCPSERDMPKSYLANEPGAARAVRNEFDPYRQVATRLQSLQANGHATDKCELIVLGGTWSAYPRQYQTWFIKRCFDAFNDRPTKTWLQAKRLNEVADNRVIGLTLETRPDMITRAEVRRLRMLGCTRVQLGVQTLDDKILKLVRRGHTRQDVVRATRLLKEAGFKISHHYMQDLPGATYAQDLQTMRDAFTSPDFQPDHIKLYPTAVIKSAQLYKWWQAGKYKPYSPQKLARLIVEIKRLVPEWVRIERIIRDIPSNSIAAGHSVTNLRQILQRRGAVCRCIRCREPREAVVRRQDVELVRREYAASGGREIFLSFESRDGRTLYAFARLRLQKLMQHWLPELSGAAIIREIHSYGRLASLARGLAKGRGDGGNEGNGNKSNVQHRGFGRELMAEAEKIARQEGYSKMAVIAGVGVREYFRKLGYKLGGRGEYMVKKLK